MALNASGPISLGGATAGQSINLELGQAATATTSLNATNVRTLAGVPSGAIIMPTNFYGKSNRATASYTYITSTANASLNITTLGGYSAGTTDVTVTVNGGVYLYASTTGNHGLTLTGGSSGDTLKLVNNGYIIGCGGNGNTSSAGSAGGPALSLGFNISLTNNSYIAGGGGGGGTAGGDFGTGSGGGAGGANGGGSICTYGNFSGGAGGSIGNAGAQGAYFNGLAIGGCGGGAGGGSGGLGSDSCDIFRSAGGGGGRQLPGGGGAGGVGFQGGSIASNGSNGGGSNAAGGAGTLLSFGFRTGGGGGGWGASGGSSGNAGGAGGKAINLNTKSITYTVTGTIWGAVS